MEEKWRFDCFPEKGATEETCKARGCCWGPLEPRSEVPWCFFAKGTLLYEFGNFTDTAYGFSGMAKLLKKSPYPKDSKLLQVDVYYETDFTVRIKVRY